jgi:hypothetical protein
MYIRFVTSQWDAFSRTNRGFFRPAYAVRGSESVPAWQRRELARELAWFDDNLDVPPVLSARTGRRQYRNGVCWFRDRAADHVSHARYVAWLLGENGLPVEELRADHPGTVIWGDDAQVVALTDRRAPYAYH